MNNSGGISYFILKNIIRMKCKISRKIFDDFIGSTFIGRMTRGINLCYKSHMIHLKNIVDFDKAFSMVIPR